MMNASELLAYANANNVDLSPYYDVNNPADTIGRMKYCVPVSATIIISPSTVAMKKPPIVHLSTTSTEKVL